MSGLMAVVAWLAVLDPPRTRLGLPEREGRGRLEIVGPGVVIGAAALLGIAGLGDDVLRALDVSPEMFQIAAGLVLVIAAAWMFFTPVPTEEPVPDGIAGALWPVAYPRVLSPAALVLAVSTGATEGVMVGPVVLAAALIVALGAMPLGPTGRRVTAAVGRLLAALLVLVAVVLAVDGIRQV